MISIAFLGNCQLAAVEWLMRRHLARDFGLQTRFLESWSSLSDQDQDTLENADVIVGQRLRFGARSDLEDLQTRGKTILVPLLGLGFLWPFAGTPHPRNAGFPFHRFGPYPAEIGDSYLNRQMAEDIDPDVAVKKYLQMDIASVVNLDRLREITTESQYRLDEVTGFCMAPHLECFQQEHIFRTPHHCDTPILIELTCQILAKIGLDAKLAEVIRTSVTINPMHDIWLPIHPGVARHFKLHYGNERHRYEYYGEGSFTFAEYAGRYMTFTWNPSLHEGIHLSALSCDAAAVPALHIGIAASPMAALGHLRLSQSLSRLGDITAATESGLRAVELAPNAAQARGNLGRLLAAKGDILGAEAEARAAVDLDPLEPDLQAFLGWLRLSRQGPAEAQSFIEAAVKMAPENPRFQLLQGDFFLASGRAAEAEATFRRVINLDPALGAAHAGLSQALAQMSRWEEAVATMQEALTLEPENPDFVFFMAHLWIKQWRLIEAEVAHRNAIALSPARAEFHAGLASFLTAAGRPRDALPPIKQAVSLAADNADYQALHNHLRQLVEAKCS